MSGFNESRIPRPQQAPPSPAASPAITPTPQTPTPPSPSSFRSNNPFSSPVHSPQHAVAGLPSPSGGIRIPVPRSRLVAQSTPPQRAASAPEPNSAGRTTPGQSSGLPRASNTPGSRLRQPSAPPSTGDKTLRASPARSRAKSSSPTSGGGGLGLQKPSVGGTAPLSPAKRPISVLSPPTRRRPLGLLSSPANSPTPARAAAEKESTPKAKEKVVLFENSFVDSREPNVPTHIRTRLRLIHKLGVVLGVNASTLSAKIDIPTLLARVDTAYEKIHPSASGSIEGSPGGLRSCLPLPGTGKRDSPLPNSPVIGSRKSKEGGMRSMFGRLGRRKDKDDGAGLADGPVFGVTLYDLPVNGWCTGLIGGRKHELPLVVFNVVEEIYRRGMTTPGIFRLAGDSARIAQLTKIFNLPPLYGDSMTLTNEPVHNLTGLIKRFVRDLPEPILDETLFDAFCMFCSEAVDRSAANASITAVDTPPTGEAEPPLARVASPPLDVISDEARVSAAQILLRLMPPYQFSLFIYLLAFFGQLPLYPENRLNVDSISIIFGPAMAAPRGKGIAGLGGQLSRGSVDSEEGSATSSAVASAQSALAWLLNNWPALSQTILDPDDPSRLPPRPIDVARGDSVDDEDISGLLSPIDLNRKADSPYCDTSKARQILNTEGKPDLNAGGSLVSPALSPTASPAPGGSPSQSPGLLARALSSISLSDKPHLPKRSASFNSLSSLMRGAGKKKEMGQRTVSDEGRRPRSMAAVETDDLSTDIPGVNPQITSVLGSLHDLLVSKDKQIERDARELAVLRSTLLEMDDKLRLASSSHLSFSLRSPLVPPERKSSMPLAFPTPHVPSSSYSAQHMDTTEAPPEILVTSTSTSTLGLVPSPSLSRETIADLQSQLTTALAALETARTQARTHTDRITELEAQIARAECERQMDRSRMELALGMEQAKVRLLVEERDMARGRLERVKDTLFASDQPKG